MNWHPPIRGLNPERVPQGDHPGAFGVKRKHHTHEGVDLYCDQGEAIFAVQTGRVICIMPFTGPAAGSPWWLPTDAVFVQGSSGIVVYGEVVAKCVEGQFIARGELVARARRVLVNDKGLPTTMLHLELRDPRFPAAFCPFDWANGAQQPEWLRNPTQHLLEIEP